MSDCDTDLYTWTQAQALGIPRTQQVEVRCR
jgi:hypothetical protein